MAGDDRNEELSTVADKTPGASSTAPLYVLRVVGGPGTGKTLVLDWNKAPQALVGQSQVCELAIPDPRVSRRHLSLTAEGNAVRLVDLQSTNGTRIGGARVVEALLEGGEAIELGDSVLRVARAGEIRMDALERDRFGRVLGKSQAMQRLFAACEALANSTLPVILEGETGTGKELLAEAMHETGPRGAAPFVVFDCAAHEEGAALEALFGGPRGPGALEQARGGTLVIDEIGELGLQAQSRLATILDRGELRREGEIDAIRANVRFIATTRDDLDRLVEEKKFREELLFRFAGARIQVPPLRQRHGDVELIARHFWKLFGGAGEIPKRLVLQLGRHPWPGNVQELEHAVSRATVLGDETEIASARTPDRDKPVDYLDHVLTMGLAMPSARQRVIREFERRFVERAVREHGGNVTRAAAASGLTRRYFHMLLAKNKA
ncbi:sigma 54-interacting transcriptional regulator [Pendulispora rubella]|uniref:Sigma 54-interacting transcriptional regulator n=1 Tax=Pendulispora rubella TaxID=2741070 RepID=A0ABZ2KVH3_9BACT